MIKTIFGFLAAAVISLSAYALTAKDQAIVDRIGHTASVCVAGDPCAGTGGAAAVTVASAARAGDAVYNAGCAACHASGAAGAPKTGDAAAWSARVDQGVDTLVSHAYNGYNAMPAKGLCADCSEDEIRNAVDYMLSQL
ncbi:cytochrome c5 family protein [Litorivicinus lipolyticus]|uniref:Cytochrome c5 family protein n=1 Tax=Litorivicinus lipolyticus TaxID=418701 RepID=A0A5Q2QBL1_9GAMM|nr:c-type cytochrome [Litorivicinus lipolyticus]QGG79396.1 cytochrome c5 family protein [Litorivicinus lipolyticus]